MIVTDNLKHFHGHVLATFGIEARSADAFIADIAMLDVGRAAAAVRQMRLRFGKPPISVDDLFVRMDAQGITETADVLRPYLGLL